MTDSNSTFSGSIPENYDKYLGPLIFETYSKDIANRINIPSTGKVLEVAAGTGWASSFILNKIPKDAQYTITDLSDAMLEIAKNKIGNSKNVEIRSADGQELPFDKESYDAVICQFGIMFFPDKQKGVNEAFRVLKAGGEYIFSVWDNYDHNPLSKFFNSKLKDMFPDNTAPFLDVPLGYYKIDEIKRVLETAGFGDIEINVLPRKVQTNAVENIPFGFILGSPLSIQIPEMGGDLEEVIEKMKSEIVLNFGDAPIEAPMQAIVIKAHKPK